MQKKINTNLKEKLKVILFRDQIYREYIDSKTSQQRKVEILNETGFSYEEMDSKIWDIIKENDLQNLEEVENIIKEYGYPGKSIVGEPENTAVFYVIQHSDKIAQYFPIIKKAGRQKELDYKYVAMMLDRKLSSEGKPQIYGTQLFGKNVYNKCTNKEEYFIYVLPIKNPQKVNKLRKRAGFNTTVEENAKEFGVSYKPFKYNDLKNIEKIICPDKKNN